MAQESWKREEEAGCQAPEGPILCTNNCGFFGSVATMNLCSKCYRELTVKQSSKAAAVNMPVLGMSSIKGLQFSSPSSSVESTPTKQQQQQQQQQEESEAAAVMSQLLDAGISTATPSTPVQAEELATSPASKSQANRCFSCRKRVGLTGFKCRCGDTFCSLHRYSDKHHCSYDYKAAARTAIAKANPVVKADKIEKI